MNKSGTIKFVIDSFSMDGVSGWTVREFDGQFFHYPLLISFANNNNVSFDVSDYLFREDLREANIGSGMFGFNVPHKMGAGEIVRIYEGITGEQLWSGVVGKPWDRVVKLELPDEWEQSDQLINPEQCMHWVNLGGLWRKESRESNVLSIYQLQVRVDNNPIYYFQLQIDAECSKPPIFNIEGLVISYREYCVIGSTKLIEYYAVDLNGDFSLNKKNCSGYVCLYDNSRRIKIKVTWKKIREPWIYVLSTNDRIVVKPNPIDDISLDTARPLFTDISKLHKTSSLQKLKTSIIKVAVNGVVSWVSEQFAYCYELSECMKNSAIGATLRFCDATSQPAFNMPALLHNYRKYGAEQFVSGLYQYILQRNPDTVGLKETVAAFKQRILDQGELCAIKQTWDSFMVSDEFKNNRNIFFSKNDPLAISI